MDTVERSHIYNETWVNNQINDKTPSNPTPSLMSSTPMIPLEHPLSSYTDSGNTQSITATCHEHFAQHSYLSTTTDFDYHYSTVSLDDKTSTTHLYNPPNYFTGLTWDCRSQWPRGLRRRSSAARLLRSWVRIPPRAWMFVLWVLCVVR